MEKEVIVWKFQKWNNFGFFIPEDREIYGWDFYVHKDNFKNAEDWDKVEVKELKYSKWKKPEVKILRVLGAEKKAVNNEYIEWIYSGWDWNFGFIDVEWMKKWYFVYWNKKAWAKDWDKVKAQIVDFKWKKEAIVVKIFDTQDEIVNWIFEDNDRFWFVTTDDWEDIFIAGSRKWWAKTWNRVEVKIIKKWGKNPEGVIIRVFE